MRKGSGAPYDHRKYSDAALETQAPSNVAASGRRTNPAIEQPQRVRKVAPRSQEYGTLDVDVNFCTINDNGLS